MMTKATMSKVTRREVLVLGAAAMATTLAGGCTGLAKRPAAPGAGGSGRRQGPLVLEAKWHHKELNGLQAKLRSYNGQVPGPTIYRAAGRGAAHPGEELR